MLRMYFDISYKMINLGQQTNQHKGTARETTAIIQTAETRPTL